MTDYHKITLADCLNVATAKQKVRLSLILDIELLKTLAMKWCTINSYKLGGYLGSERWDATKLIASTKEEDDGKI